MVLAVVAGAVQMQGMRDLLRLSLARSLRTLPEEDRLAAALPVVCGSALAAHCSVDRLDEDGTLHLSVRGREWIGPLLAMREVLQHDLARISGVNVLGLRFESMKPGIGREALPAQPVTMRKLPAKADRVPKRPALKTR